MKLSEALEGVSSLLVDTAPAIYHLERNPAYAQLMAEFFRLRSERDIRLVTSPITLAECLVHPVQRGLSDLAASYYRLILEGENTEFHTIGSSEAAIAARMRVRYGLRLTDALQAAVAVQAGCQAILTNDAALKRVREVRILVLSEVQP